MAPHYPARVPELMAYMVGIIRAHQEFEGTACSAYDDAYRRLAAASGDWQWSRVNPSLYTVCYTGRARKTARCERCLSAGHKTEECSLLGEDDTDVSKRLKAIESAVVVLTQAGNPNAGKGQAGEICRKFNRGDCTLRFCRYAHLCSACRGSHPVSQCFSKARTEQGANAASLGQGRRLPPPRMLQPGHPY